MGAFINGVYHEHADLKAQAAAAHARIDRAACGLLATAGGYRTALDEPGDPAPLDISPSPDMSLSAIRERAIVGGGDRRQLLADRLRLLELAADLEGA